METGKEMELSYLCGMIQNGKIPYEDAVCYLNLMKDEYGIGEIQFGKLYSAWVRNGEFGNELNRIRFLGGYKRSSGLYKYILDGLYETVEQGEMDLDMVTENLWQDDYEVKEDPGRGLAGFYPELPGCIGYGENREKLHMNMKNSLKNWICAAYDQWREEKLISRNSESIFGNKKSYT